MQPALMNRIDLMPGLSIIPESPQYHVQANYCSGWILVSKDQQFYRIAFMEISKLSHDAREFFRVVAFSGANRWPWTDLVKKTLGPRMLNGYAVEDVVFFDFESKEMLEIYKPFPLMTFMKPWMKEDVV